MGALFDLLQTQVESGDGSGHQTLDGDTHDTTFNTTTHMLHLVCFQTAYDYCAVVFFMGCTSGGVLAGGVVREVLEEALDGEGLMDTLESLSAPLGRLPFTWGHTRSSASLYHMQLGELGHFPPVKMRSRAGQYGQEMRYKSIYTLLILFHRPIKQRLRFNGGERIILLS